jgi:hypothetical protein
MALPVSRYRTSPFLVSLLAALVGAGCHSQQPPAKADDRVSVTQQGDTTVVIIEDREREPENAVCKSYCERLSACWYAVPNADPMLSPQDIFARCWAEQHQCRTVMTEALCCGSLTACGDFVKCQGSGRDVVSTCTHLRLGSAATQ